MYVFGLLGLVILYSAIIPAGLCNFTKFLFCQRNWSSKQLISSELARRSKASLYHSKSVRIRNTQISVLNFCFHFAAIKASRSMATRVVFTRSTSTVLLLLAAVISLAINSVNGAKIDITNQCGQTITACATCCGGSQVNCYVLNARGGRQQINVGGNWPAGLVWGFPGNSGNPATGNNAKPQANLAEFTVGAGGQDFYDISNVDAYNLPMRVAPTQIAGGGRPSGTHCGTIVCAINDLNNFCRGPNFLTGPPGNGCKNANGPGLQPTAGTRAFKSRCPTSYSYSKDDAGTVFGCETGSNYEVVFCPASGSTAMEESPAVIQEVVAAEDRH